MSGISHYIHLISAKPSAEQIAIYSVLIRSLRDLPYEHIVFEFRNSDEMTGPDDELYFYQLCVDHDHIMRTEIRTGPSGHWKLYARNCPVEEAIDMFKQLNETRTAPDLDGWEDITETIRNKEL